MTSGSLPPRQQIRLCGDPDCPVVYFGDQGVLVTVESVRTVPGFKLSGRGQVCYCFGYTEKEIAGEIRPDEVNRIDEFVRNQIADHNCACDVRNPSGKCCLPEVSRIVKQARKELAR